MARITYSVNAIEDLNRLAEFMDSVSPHTTADVLETITLAIEQLSLFPELGRQSQFYATLREMSVPFGKGVYLVLYHFNMTANIINILALKHSKEQSYRL